MAKPNWLKIDTAPMDGTWVRVRGFNYGDPTKGRHHATAFYEDSSWIEVGSGGSLLFYLTDWAPLHDAALQQEAAR